MDEMYRLSQAAKLLGIHPATLRRWAEEGRIRCVRLGKERRFPASEIRRLRGEQNEDACILYGRVSSHGQKDDLKRQMDTLRDWARDHCPDAEIIELQDVGSGLNARRKGLGRLFTIVQQRRVRMVVITFKDRLSRFGFEYIQAMCESYGVEITVLNDDEDKTAEQELVDDLIAIVTSFAGRLYGMRSAKARGLVQCVENATKASA
jgi:excisionase family DNA binding protein